MPDPIPDAKASSLKGILGCLAVFASAFCFYFSTVVIRWSRDVVSIDSAYFAFFLSSLVRSVSQRASGSSTRPGRAGRWVAGRNTNPAGGGSGGAARKEES